MPRPPVPDPCLDICCDKTTIAVSVHWDGSGERVGCQSVGWVSNLLFCIFILGAHYSVPRSRRSGVCEMCNCMSLILDNFMCLTSLSIPDFARIMLAAKGVRSRRERSNLPLECASGRSSPSGHWADRNARCPGSDHPGFNEGDAIWQWIFQSGPARSSCSAACL